MGHPVSVRGVAERVKVFLGPCSSVWQHGSFQELRVPSIDPKLKGSSDTNKRDPRLRAASGGELGRGESIEGLYKAYKGMA